MIRRFRLPDWQKRPLSDAEAALSNLDLPHRSWMAEHFCSVMDTNERLSVLEVGCSYGPNLFALAARTNWQLSGIDISTANVEVGRDQLERQGLVDRIGLSVADIGERTPFLDCSFDLVFTDATLLYLSPRHARAAMAEIVRISRGFVAFCELATGAAYPKFRRNRDGWLYNYAGILNGIERVEDIDIIRVPPNVRGSGRWASHGQLVIARLGRNP